MLWKLPLVGRRSTEGTRQGSHLPPASSTRKRPRGGEGPAAHTLGAPRPHSASEPGSSGEGKFLLPDDASPARLALITSCCRPRRSTGGTPGPQEAGSRPGCSSSGEARNPDPVTGTHMYVRTHVHATHTQTYTANTHAHMRTQCTLEHTCAHMFTHSTCMLTCTHARARSTHAYSHACTCSNTYTHAHTKHKFPCTCVLTHAHTNTHAHALTCTHIHL